MDEAIDGIETDKAQEDIYKFLIEYIYKFNSKDGFFSGDDFTKILYVQKKIREFLDRDYIPTVYKYLKTYDPVQDEIVKLNKEYNDLIIDTDKLDPIRKTMYNQAKYFLVDDGMDANYVQPIKYVLLQQITKNASIEDTKKLLGKWQDGKLTAGSTLTSERPTPNLKQYSTAISRNSFYGYYGTVNELIADEYNLDHFIYTGGLVSDSRPFCKHLVGLRRKIAISEVPALLKKYPQGIIPDTTKENFLARRGGFSCRHGAFAVKG